MSHGSNGSGKERKKTGMAKPRRQERSGERYKERQNQKAEWQRKTSKCQKKQEQKVGGRVFYDQPRRFYNLRGFFYNHLKKIQYILR